MTKLLIVVGILVAINSDKFRDWLDNTYLSSSGNPTPNTVYSEEGVAKMVEGGFAESKIYLYDTWLGTHAYGMYVGESSPFDTSFEYEMVLSLVRQYYYPEV